MQAASRGPWRARARDLLGALLLSTGVTAPARRGCNRLAILTFHRVLPAQLAEDYPMANLAVRPDELDWLIGFFASHYRCVSVTDGVARVLDDAETDERPLLALTFDDGMRDNFDYARPILARHRIPATFYAVAGYVDGAMPMWYDLIAFAWVRDVDLVRASLRDWVPPLRSLHVTLEALKTCDPDAVDAAASRVNDAVESKFGAGWWPNWDRTMTWAQLQQLCDEGHEVGCHAMAHPILPRCSDARLRHEVADARETMARHLKAPVRSFCYPNGDWDGRVATAVRDAGFDHAVTTRPGRVGKNADRMALPRFDIQSQTSRGSNGELSPARLAWRLSGLHPGLR